MATVFGILNLVFGAFALLGQAIGVIMIVFLREKLEEEKQKETKPGRFN